MNLSMPLAANLSSRPGAVTAACEVRITSGPLPVNSMKAFMASPFDGRATCRIKAQSHPLGQEPAPPPLSPSGSTRGSISPTARQAAGNAWMPGSSPGMTRSDGVAALARLAREDQRELAGRTDIGPAPAAKVPRHHEPTTPAATKEQPPPCPTREPFPPPEGRRDPARQAAGRCEVRG